VAVFHPVVQDGADAARQMRIMLDSLLAAEVQVLVLAPNADAGGSGIADVMREAGAAHPDQVRLIDHLPRPRYLDWLAAADLLIGNSSSGIIESASLGLPCVNLGDRQMARDRNTNVIDVPTIGAQAVTAAIATALQQGRQDWPNIWGDGRTAPRIAAFLAEVDLNPAVLRKLNSY